MTTTGKRGPLSKADKEFIVFHMENMNAESIAANINRDAKSVQRVMNLERSKQEASEDTEALDDIKDILKTEKFWKNLERQMTAREPL